MHPDVLFSKGAGYSDLVSRVFEQAAQFHVPMMVFDREGDLLSAVGRFTRGVIGTLDNCPSSFSAKKSI